MSKEYLIVGDIAGEYDTLMALIAKAPQGLMVVSVGDMVDRGPDSAKVVNEFMTNPNFKAVLGNHDHMMWNNLAELGYYPNDVWFWNGGTPTVKSYEKEGIDILTRSKKGPSFEKQQAIIAWLSNLPLYITDPDTGLFISHSFPNPSMPLDTACDLARWGKNYSQVEMSIIWNRGQPRRMKGFFQVTGHNSHWGHKTFSDAEGDFGVCIDTSRSKVLTGLHWPSKTIYQQEYIIQPEALEPTEE